MLNVGRTSCYEGEHMPLNTPVLVLSLAIASVWVFVPSQRKDRFFAKHSVDLSLLWANLRSQFPWQAKLKVDLVWFYLRAILGWIIVAALIPFLLVAGTIALLLYPLRGLLSAPNRLGRGVSWMLVPIVYGLLLSGITASIYFFILISFSVLSSAVHDLPW